MDDQKQTILYFGDQTDSFVDGIDQLFLQASSTPWLNTFLKDLTVLLKEETKDLPDVVRESMGTYDSLAELADGYRDRADQVGLARAFLLHAVRSGMLLQWVERDPNLVNCSLLHLPERLGISGGLVNMAALGVATSFRSLYDALLEVARIFVRLSRFCSARSRAMEDRVGVWGIAVLGMEVSRLREVLDRFQQRMGIPKVKRARVGVTGDRWSTVIGPPSVLELVVKQCKELGELPKNELSIHALQHVVDLTDEDLEYIVGFSPLLKRPIVPGFRMWGMDDPHTSYDSWSDLIKAVVTQVLSKPLDVREVVKALGDYIGNKAVDITIVGPTSHLSYLTSSIRATSGFAPSLRTDADLVYIPRSNDGRIAIVGMSGRGPGCQDLDEFWKVIMSKQDMSREVPADRFDVKEYYDQNQKEGCKMTTRYGCFMDNPGNFDARFFRVSKREALLLDPGHRQFLHATYEALENAGYSELSEIDRRRIATFYGQSNDDWHMLSHDTLGCDAYTLQGAQRAFGAGRIPFHFKWEGPSFSLDSACGSSTSGINLACVGLNAGNYDMAVVGASNIVGYPHSFTSLSKSGVLSDTGNCKPYRADADGYCRADFVGCVVLKRLDDALAENDNVLAIIAGSARNASGTSNSITTSDAGAQERLFRKVLREAHVRPSQVDYIEMHATGTQVGDVAEMTSVASVFSKSGTQPLLVGGVKANIGHSEAAAGMSSLIKSVLMLQHNIIPPQAGVDRPLNPKYPDLSSLKIEIAGEPREFVARHDGPRRVLVNNFDAAGGNSCILLEEYEERSGPLSDVRRTHIVALTAKSETSLQENQRQLLQWLRNNPGARLEDIAYTTTARRIHHSRRRTFLASTIEELVAALEKPYVVPLQTGSRPVVFVFTGQGSHYQGMGRELYTQGFPAFRDTVDACVSICAQHGFPPFLDLILNDVPGVGDDYDIVQTCLAVLTLEIALAALWTACGVKPAMVTGHSLGEFTALHVAGVLSLADVLYLGGGRAQLLLERVEPGAYSMLAISESADIVQSILNDHPQTSCEIACRNSPSATVVSGLVEDVQELTRALKSPSKVLPVSYGFHSSQMDAVHEDYVALASGVTFLTPKIPVASTLLGSIVDSAGTFSPHYLGEHTRRPVTFVDAINATSSWLKKPASWLEIGPRPVCGPFVQRTITSTEDRIMFSLERGLDASLSISRCLANLWAQGTPVKWQTYHRPFEAHLKLLSLPTYAWDMQNFWITYSESARHGQSDMAPRVSHSHRDAALYTCAQFVTEQNLMPSLTVSFQSDLSSPQLTALLHAHKIRDMAVLPGSVFCESALAAARYALHLGSMRDQEHLHLSMSDVVLKRPLTEEAVKRKASLVTTITTKGTSNDNFSVAFTMLEGSIVRDVGGCRVSLVDSSSVRHIWQKSAFFIGARMQSLMETARAGQGHVILHDLFYALFGSTVEYSPAFKTVRETYVSADFQEAVARVQLRADPPDTRFIASPYWGEALVQVAGFLVNTRPGAVHKKSMFMMEGFESLDQTSVFEAGQTYSVFAHVVRKEKGRAWCDVYVFKDINASPSISDPEILMHCSGLRFQEVSHGVLDLHLGSASSSRQQPVSPVTTSKLQDLPLDAASIGAQERERTIPFSETSFSVVEQHNADTKVDLSASRPNQQKVTVGVFRTILECIAEATGNSVGELSDQTALTDLGVDSIMGIEIAAKVNNRIDQELPMSFLVEYPTIALLRQAFSDDDPSPQNSHPQVAPNTESATNSDMSWTDAEDAGIPTGDSTPFEVSVDDSAGESAKIHDVAKTSENGNDETTLGPPPVARVMLLQGRRSSEKAPLYLIADGTGSIATYIHLPLFKSRQAIYGIDSPFLRCPGRFTVKMGISGAAKLIVDALAKAQPEGELSIGGFSGGAMLSYEVTRQLTTMGRKIDSLFLIDMCCPRPRGAPDKAEVGWKVYEQIAKSNMGTWNASSSTEQHLRAIFACVANYHPPPLPESSRPRNTAIIWAKKGLIDHCSGNLELLQLLARNDIPTERFDGFMQDARMGAIAWGIPHKSQEDLGPNGWENYVGENTWCTAIDAHHLELPMPGHVQQLHAAMEEAFARFSKG